VYHWFKERLVIKEICADVSLFQAKVHFAQMSSLKQHKYLFFLSRTIHDIINLVCFSY